MDTATIKAGGLVSALNLATAGGMNLTDSATLMSNALNAFRNDNLKAADAANILAGAANASAADMIDLKFGLAAVGPVSAGIGMSLKDTSAALALFSNYSLSGQDAGTSFKTMLSNLEPKTKKANELMMDLGIVTKNGSNAFFDAKGNVKSLADVAGVLHKALGGMTAQQRQSTLYTLFGSDAIRAGNILYEAGAKGVKKMYGEMGKVTALDVAKQKMNNASGAVEQFKGALETLQISVLTPLMPVIKNGANALADWVSHIKPEQIKQWGDNISAAGQKVVEFAGFIHKHWSGISTTVEAIAAAVITLKVGLTGLMIVSTITKLFNAWRAGTLALTMAELGLNAAMLLNPWTWVIAGIAALVAAGVVLYKNWGKVKSVWNSVWDSIKSAAAKGVNSVIDGINTLISQINKIPGVNFPLVAHVKWDSGVQAAPGRLGARSVTDKITVNKKPTTTAPYNPNYFSNMINGSHAGGLSRVPYDGYIARLHRDERVLPAGENEKYSSGKGNVFQFGDIHLHGVGGDLEGAANKLLDIMATKIQLAGGAGA